jgi:hypothetical protein
MFENIKKGVTEKTSPFLWKQPSVGPQTKSRRYDNMLLGQGCHTPRGALIDEYGAMAGWWLAGEIKELERNMFLCHFVHQGL